MLGGRPINYPNLSAFLEFQRRHPSGRNPKKPLPVGVVIVGALFLGLLLGDQFAWICWISMAILVGLAGWFLYDFSKGSAAPDEAAVSALRRQSLEAGRRMRGALKNRRLHRDVGEPSLVLLDEAARQWGRVSTNLQHPFWNAAQLPMHYEAIRDQAARAADAAMDEVLALYMPLLPNEHERRPFTDVVGEALENFTRKGSSSEPIPPMFEPTRQLAEKLRSLADELERITARAAIDPDTFAKRHAGAALDSAIHEMQSLNRAEQELSSPPVNEQHSSG